MASISGFWPVFLSRGKHTKSLKWTIIAGKQALKPDLAVQIEPILSGEQKQQRLAVEVASLIYRLYNLISPSANVD